METWNSVTEPKETRVIEKAASEEKIEPQNAEDVWKRVTEVLDKALTDYPDARWAVLRAIEEEFLNRDAA